MRTALFTDARLGEIIWACDTALKRADLCPNIRKQVEAIRKAAAKRARLMLGEF